MLSKEVSSNYYFIGLGGRVFANGPRNLGSIPGCIIPKTLKMVLDTSLLNISNIRYVSRVKWSNPGKAVVPSPTPQCSSYWKGSLLVTLDYGHQLFFTLFKGISTYVNYLMSKPSLKQTFILYGFYYTAQPHRLLLHFCYSIENPIHWGPLTDFKEIRGRNASFFKVYHFVRIIRVL